MGYSPAPSPITTRRKLCERCAYCGVLRGNDRTCQGCGAPEAKQQRYLRQCKGAPPPPPLAGETGKQYAVRTGIELV